MDSAACLPSVQGEHSCKRDLHPGRAWGVRAAVRDDGCQLYFTSDGPRFRVPRNSCSDHVHVCAGSLCQPMKMSAVRVPGNSSQFLAPHINHVGPRCMCRQSAHAEQQVAGVRHRSVSPHAVHNNSNHTIWRGSVLTGEEPPPHSGELNHALSRVGGPTQSQLSRPMSSRHHISMEHRLRRKCLL